MSKVVQIYGNFVADYEYTPHAATRFEALPKPTEYYTHTLYTRVNLKERFTWSDPLICWKFTRLYE